MNLTNKKDFRQQTNNGGKKMRDESVSNKLDKFKLAVEAARINVGFCWSQLNDLCELDERIKKDFYCFFDLIAKAGISLEAIPTMISDRVETMEMTRKNLGLKAERYKKSAKPFTMYSLSDDEQHQTN